jgi:outer membrane lipoprotein-sorting protein
MRQHRIVRNATMALVALGLGFGLLPQVSESHAGPSGREIMEKFSVARKVDGSEAVVTMSIIESGGAKRERSISIATKVFDGGDTEKRLYRFMAPADVKGTGILVFDYGNKADDQWIYLPALRKTRRILSSEKSKSFMGSDFTYGDLNDFELNDFTYDVTGEEDAGGEKCWVVDVVPKSKQVAQGEGYQKKTYWISKKTYAMRKGALYDMDGKLIKEVKADDIKLLDPKKQRYRAMRTEMTNKKTGRRSVFEFNKIAFAPDTKDEYFTTRYLERE